MTSKHHSETYNMDSNSDSFCAYLVTVVPILRHGCGRTTHPAVTVVSVLRAVVFKYIMYIVDLINANIYSKTNFNKETVH